MEAKVCKIINIAVALEGNVSEAEKAEIQAILEKNVIETIRKYSADKNNEAEQLEMSWGGFMERHNLNSN